jgi:hypothetical protein
MASQFCKFQETLFRKVIVLDEYYSQLKEMHLFLLHPVFVLLVLQLVNSIMLNTR